MSTITLSGPTRQSTTEKLTFATMATIERLTATSTANGGVGFVLRHKGRDLFVAQAWMRSVFYRDDPKIALVGVIEYDQTVEDIPLRELSIRKGWQDNFN